MRRRCHAPPYVIRQLPDANGSLLPGLRGMSRRLLTKAPPTSKHYGGQARGAPTAPGLTPHAAPYAACPYVERSPRESRSTCQRGHVTRLYYPLRASSLWPFDYAQGPRLHALRPITGPLRTPLIEETTRGVGRTLLRQAVRSRAFTLRPLEDSGHSGPPHVA